MKLLILILILFLSCTHTMMVSDIKDFHKIWKNSVTIVSIDTVGSGSNKIYIIEYYPPENK